MKKPREYELRIEAYSPETIPMAHLAEYLKDLAILLGEYKSVHLVRLDNGSTRLIHTIEYEAEPKVRQRISDVRNQVGPPDAQRAARDINRRLAQDNGSGVLLDPTDAKIIEFPGRERFNQQRYGPFNEAGTIEGIPIRIGGEGDPVPVHLEEPGQEPHICHASRSMAQQIAPFIFSTMIRAEGQGRWHRESDGTWVQDRFTILSFQKLYEAPLSEVVGRLRAVPSLLKEIKDPLDQLYEIRHGEEFSG
jgi:hypothetical protein